FWILIGAYIIEIMITTILICKFCKSCNQMGIYRWYLIGLIPSSIIFSLLMVTVRGMRARFPLNYIFLFLNILLLCYTFIPSILRITLPFIIVSFVVASLISIPMILLGMLIKAKISPYWLIAVLVSFIAVGLIISITLCALTIDVALNVMGAFFLLSVLPFLLFIGQQLKMEYSQKMLPSKYMLYAVLISTTYLFIFYSIAVQFYNLQKNNKIIIWECLQCTSYSD
ncbi:unnamed protein product, partial [Schistosoma turkestanicum]